MFRTKYGPFDGDTWEDLCQQIFKKKYSDEGYQEMVASPGDFGVEGYTKKTGLAFQCYCPDAQYTQGELYEKQRDKITADLGKLKRYEKQIQARIGDTKFKEWIFVTPEVNHNKLLEHAQTKQEEVRAWGLSIIDDNFTVLVMDGDFYATEITQFQTINGEKLVFDDNIAEIKFHDREDVDEYEENINRKNKIRCNYNTSGDSETLDKFNATTIKKWFEGERIIKLIEANAPTIYHHLSRVINQYEDEVAELSLTWKGEADDLTSRVREGLFIRLKEELPEMSASDQRKISDHMISKWIALCPLDFK